VERSPGAPGEHPVGGVASSPGVAASPHHVTGAHGDNTLTSADVTLTGTVTTTSQCLTRGGNPVNGVPKSETINVSATGTFPARHGQTTGSLTIARSCLNGAGLSQGRITGRPALLTDLWFVWLVVPARVADRVRTIGWDGGGDHPEVELVETARRLSLSKPRGTGAGTPSMGQKRHQTGGTCCS